MNHKTVGKGGVGGGGNDTGAEGVRGGIARVGAHNMGETLDYHNTFGGIKPAWENIHIKNFTTDYSKNIHHSQKLYTTHVI